MKQLHSVVIPDGKVRHLAFHYNIHGPFKTMCGLLWTNAHVDELDTPYAISKTRVCQNCLRVRRNHDVDTLLPAVDQGAAQRGRALADEGGIREVPGRIYRVQGIDGRIHGDGAGGCGPGVAVYLHGSEDAPRGYV